MELWKLILIPVIGFVIGYGTNYVAIKMLFHPRTKRFGLQGVFPRRKRALARSIGAVSVHVLPDSVQSLVKVPVIGEAVLSRISASIEKQILLMNDEELERLILKVVSKELSFITWMGGVLGLLIGLVQVAILLI